MIYKMQGISVSLIALQPMTSALRWPHSGGGKTQDQYSWLEDFISSHIDPCSTQSSGLCVEKLPKQRLSAPDTSSRGSARTTCSRACLDRLVKGENHVAATAAYVSNRLEALANVHRFDATSREAGAHQRPPSLNLGSAPSVLGA